MPAAVLRQLVPLTAGRVPPRRWARTCRWQLLALSALAAGTACASDAPARPQLVVWIDSTAPVPGQASADASISGAAAVDTLRIDVFGEGGQVVDVLEISLPEAQDWPVSFGVATSASQGRVELRVRAFRAGESTRGSVELPDGSARGVLEPVAEVAIERLLWLTGPAAGVEYVEVVLDADCIGRRARFGSNASTCVDAARPLARPDKGIEPASSVALPSRVGSWALARSIDCSTAAPPGAVCIAGGFSVLGDRDLVGLDDEFLSSAPLRPVLLSPFFMDETEFTVARYEALLGRLQARRAADPNSPIARRDLCTSELAGAAAQGLPLNCVSAETAEELCALSGGSLPSEAQWEHAARGRQGRVYPWGRQPPECCAAGLCLEAPRAAGVPPSDCAGPEDVSRDGVRDLLGNLGELTRDAFVAYDQPCWAHAPLLRDPYCPDDVITSRVQRGNDWQTSSTLSRLALRRRFVANEQSPLVGFRCVYADE